jgi:hypothetical protein
VAAFFGLASAGLSNGFFGTPLQEHKLGLSADGNPSMSEARSYGEGQGLAWMPPEALKPIKPSRADELTDSRSRSEWHQYGDDLLGSVFRSLEWLREMS